MPAVRKSAPHSGHTNVVSPVTGYRHRPHDGSAAAPRRTSKNPVTASAIAAASVIITAITDGTSIMGTQSYHKDTQARKVCDCDGAEPRAECHGMKAGFVPGITREVQVVVTEDMCPAFDGVVVHRVCSTWSMAHQMEVTARKVLVDFLEPHEEGIGGHISIDHVAPIAVGKMLTVRATLAYVRRHFVWCDVSAYDGARLLATGRQLLVVLPKTKLAEILERA
jgi:predicted thioesterase